ncbi:penicillin-binding protein [Halalkalibacterium halodurans]|uniref:serine-type D-Ala-D-Ala carboxypeptidase n=1 Tax=Halalkalibacterium halodurans (strain ATCC BAA-125 / DSM 18197 / FERM 7344 / JCM 9153 / C-125) TaxID=272558 RepID=Q9K9S2_HALH5|nr:penicillin-binding protein [Halalkalibacterium halodurans]MDY7223109.1 penicillin-binding protein [Halalkalibacterium halodurans]MDY7242330.1 penicillin-binding protein [Halalkalibacterium halodurans]MED4125416.1 penicillin-binding protein [Halalkalibacterium halodurans]MED4172035.1 penicillin-binding protein [Halalkalibacterium halodurans]BAB06292.1 penicillin-binding protein 2B (cell-division septum) [Halalkalibacterium halodurans C-125]
MDIKRAATNKRAVLMLVLFIVVFSVLIARFLYLQIEKEVKGYSLQAIAEARWTSSEVLHGKRGTIRDRNGDALAEEVTSYSVYAVLDNSHQPAVEDPERTAQLLAEHINMSEERLLELLTRDVYQVELGAGARNLTQEQRDKIADLDLPGIYFTEEPRRYYPKHTYASHLIGYTDRDMGESRMGLERSLDEYLRGEDGEIRFKKDGQGIPLPRPSEQIEPAKTGNDVYLTLDSNIQTALDQVMTQVEEEYKPERIIAIVADPKTGQILAMSNRPTFNPNEYEQITNYMNYAVSDRYEPGSTMKVFTLAAALEEGVLNVNEQYQSGTYAIRNDTNPPIRDHNQGRGWGTISYLEAMQRSSNVGFSKIALEKLGPEKLYEYLDEFGFGEPTGIDLPNEAASVYAKGALRDAASTAFGQGTAVTPIQQIQAMTAIANDGKMMKPYVVDRIVDSETGEVIEEKEPEVVGEPISKETAKEVRDILETVVTSSSGTGRPFYLEGFDVAGKTGTAQVRNPDGPGYLNGHGKNIFSFIGMAPKDDPSVIVYVAVDRPSLNTNQVGSEPVAKIFNTIMNHSLQYLNISPSVEELKDEEEEGYELADFIGESARSAREELEQAGMKVYVLGEGDTVEGQQPYSGHKLLEGERVILRTESESYTLPSMIGWSLRDVLKVANVLDVNVNLFGQGFVVGQSIEEGDTITPGDYMVVELASPTRKKTKTDEKEEDEE